MARDEATTPHRFSGTPLRSLRIEVVAGPDSGQRLVSESDTITVGSGPGNDLMLSDETVSRYHAEFRRDRDRILVFDLGSTNGTSFGAAALERASVPRGSVLKLGKTEIKVDEGEIVSVELYDDDDLHGLRGRSPVMRRLMAEIDHVGKTNASVLLLGETGSGKEVIARAIHEASPRAGKPFEVVDCGVLMPTLVASELFGHERGAFTGADQQHVGAFERADGGTIFLDEIGELPAPLQANLLGALERRSFRRVGGTKPIAVDVRVICATHRDLRAEVNENKFRQDLYFRIAVVLLRVPPLRERIDDIPLLVEHFLRAAGHNGSVDEVVPLQVMQSLQQHHWPGNVRELRNFVESALALGRPPALDLLVGQGRTDSTPGGSGFPAVPLSQLLGMTYKEARARLLDEFERLYMQTLFERAQGNVSEAARLADMNRPYLSTLRKRLGLG
ncbi:MAG: sigma 54-dependent Fis family transcriptional regulator [Deltaproteobacteria bacterium]|nr:sigma 54-dependent Fis family transcriptional regulator [Deltaproteobacteria bacterium]